MVLAMAGTPPPTFPMITVLLAGALAAVWAASFINFEGANANALVDAIQQRSPMTRSRLSPQAREAVTRAEKRGSITSPDLALIDVGMIVTSSGDEGAVLRRSRNISKDDDNVRPFITLQVAPHEADRSCKIRFEMIDQSGNEQYIHEMNVYLRDGEVNILADHHLPLANNPRIEGIGDWDLRVSLDGKLMGIHTLTLEPSAADRRGRLSGENRPRRYVIPAGEEEDEDVPLSLEDLLRDQNHNRSRK
jgi:hypothetical protein